MRGNRRVVRFSPSVENLERIIALDGSIEVCDDPPPPTTAPAPSLPPVGEVLPTLDAPAPLAIIDDSGDLEDDGPTPDPVPTPLELVDIVPDDAPPPPTYTLPDYPPFYTPSAPVGPAVTDGGTGVVISIDPTPDITTDPDSTTTDTQSDGDDPYVEATPVQPVSAYDCSPTDDGDGDPPIPPPTDPTPPPDDPTAPPPPPPPAPAPTPNVDPTDPPFVPLPTDPIGPAGPGEDDGSDPTATPTDPDQSGV